MVIFDYTHAFTIQQLNVILTQYLQLGPYYECLQKVLKNFIINFESLQIQQRHNSDKQHPIRLPINFYNYKSQLSGRIDNDSYQGELQFVYPLTTIIEIINSKQYYQSLPKNIIINGLLTTTNINIIIQTLTVLSEDWSRLIMSTLESVEEKRVTNCIVEFVDSLDEGNGEGNEDANRNQTNQIKNSLKNLGPLANIIEQKLDQVNLKQKYPITESEIHTIRIYSADNVDQINLNPQIDIREQGNQKAKLDAQRKKSKKLSILASLINKKELKNSDKQSVAFKLIDSQSDQQFNNLCQAEKNFIKKLKYPTECQYCRNYRNYLLESTGLSYFDLQQISRISSDGYKVLKKIKNSINAFTLYLKETNRTTLPANIHLLNKVLSTINLVITEDTWQEFKQNNIDNNKKENNSKSSQKTHTLLTQIQPYFDQVYNYKSHDSNELSIDQIVRICLKAVDSKEVQKILVDKYMSEARIMKEGKDIWTFCITKQRFSHQNLKLDCNQNQIITDSSNQMMNSNFQPLLNEIELMREYQKEQAIINRAVINSKPIYAQINQDCKDEIIIGTQMKKKKIQINAKTSRKNLQKSQIIKESKKDNQAHENQKFKMMIYQQYMRNQGFNINKNNISAIINQNVEKLNRSTNLIFPKENQNSVNQGLTNPGQGFNKQCKVKTKGNSNKTLSGTHLRFEQDNNTSYEKKQTEIYNKMLLNGETLRNEVLNQVQYVKAIIYDSLEDFIKKLEQMNTQIQRQELEKQKEENDNQKLFLTMCRSNIRKSTSHTRNNPDMRKTLNYRESITNQRKINLKYNLHQDSTKQKALRNDKQTPYQVSVNEFEPQSWNENIQLKKPQWLNHFVENTEKQQKHKKCVKNGKTLLENQRFLAFQQKNFLKEYLSAEKLNSTSMKTQKAITDNNQMQQKNRLKQNKTMTNLKRPLSGINQLPKSRINTIKSLGQAIVGDRHSKVVLGKQFALENNSILSNIYKENIESNVSKFVKNQVKDQKIFEDFKKKIQKSKFRVDNLLN